MGCRTVLRYCFTKIVKYKKKQKKKRIVEKLRFNVENTLNYSQLRFMELKKTLLLKMPFTGGAHLLDGCRFVEESWTGWLRVEIQQGSGPPPPIVLIGDQEMYSGLKWRWHLVPNSSCLNYPAADKGWSFNKSWEGKIAGWRTLMKCLGAYFELEIRT